MGLDIYTIYIFDDRYSVPTLDILDARTEAEALAEAEAKLAASAHYQSIEIWTTDGLLARVGPDSQDEAPATLLKAPQHTLPIARS